ncbi:putative Exoskeleton protein RP43 [Paratrimastix pyriformis]|uniref:Exoskeleton protein RP43 n=1 Tax=Paratrimastix pyriformis TaxID=342808 RepID=A0ABQ8UP16_9EUKA|nr:putative Exoskeleton protein RP43 [Paratrimastix pyriformis]
MRPVLPWLFLCLVALLPAVTSGTCLIASGGSVLTSATGNFTVTASDYQNDQECDWYLSPILTASQTLSIWFSSFDTELNYDLVKILGADGSTLAQFSGTTTTTTIVYSTPVTIRFTSDSSVTKNGFTVNWFVASTVAEMCSGTVTATASSGTITDGSTTQYMNSMSCSWVIAPVGMSTTDRIRIHFTELDTESGADFVTIYDGPTASSAVLGTYSGSRVPVDVAGSGISMLVTWASDAQNVAGGFTLQYSVVAGDTVTCSVGPTSVLSASSGAFGSGPAWYTNKDCSWLLAPTPRPPTGHWPTPFTRPFPGCLWLGWPLPRGSDARSQFYLALGDRLTSQPPSALWFFLVPPLDRHPKPIGIPAHPSSHPPPSPSQVYDGSSATSPTLFTLDGADRDMFTEGPAMLVGGGPQLFLHMAGLSGRTMPGFTAAYESLPVSCNLTDAGTHTDASGVIALSACKAPRLPDLRFRLNATDRAASSPLLSRSFISGLTRTFADVLVYEGHGTTGTRLRTIDSTANGGALSFTTTSGAAMTVLVRTIYEGSSVSLGYSLEAAAPAALTRGVVGSSPAHDNVHAALTRGAWWAPLPKHGGSRVCVVGSLAPAAPPHIWISSRIPATLPANCYQLDCGGCLAAVSTAGCVWCEDTFPGRCAPANESCAARSMSCLAFTRPTSLTSVIGGDSLDLAWSSKAASTVSFFYSGSDGSSVNLGPYDNTAGSGSASFVPPVASSSAVITGVLLAQFGAHTDAISFQVVPNDPALVVSQFTVETPTLTELPTSAYSQDGHLMNIALRLTAPSNLPLGFKAEVISPLTGEVLAESPWSNFEWVSVALWNWAGQFQLRLSDPAGIQPSLTSAWSLAVTECAFREENYLQSPISKPASVGAFTGYPTSSVAAGQRVTVSFAATCTCPALWYRVTLRNADTGEVAQDLPSGPVEPQGSFEKSIDWVVPSGLSGSHHFELRCLDLNEYAIDTTPAFVTEGCTSERRLVLVSPGASDTFSAGSLMTFAWQQVCGFDAELEVTVTMHITYVFGLLDVTSSVAPLFYYTYLTATPFSVLSPLSDGTTIAQRYRPFDILWRTGLDCPVAIALLDQSTGATTPIASGTRGTVDPADEALYASNPKANIRFHYSWNVPGSLVAGRRYAIKVSNGTQWAVSGAFSACSFTLSELGQTSYTGGDTLPIGWHTECPTGAALSLAVMRPVASGALRTEIASIASPADGRFPSWGRCPFLAVVLVVSMSSVVSMSVWGRIHLVRGFVHLGGDDPSSCLSPFRGGRTGSDGTYQWTIPADFSGSSLYISATWAAYSATTATTPGFRVTSRLAYTVVDTTGVSLFASLPIVRRFQVTGPTGTTACNMAESWLNYFDFSLTLSTSPVAFTYTPSSALSVCDAGDYVVSFDSAISSGQYTLGIAFKGVAQTPVSFSKFNLATDISMTTSTAAFPTSAAVGQTLIVPFTARTSSGALMPCRPGSALLTAADGSIRPLLRQGSNRGGMPLANMTQLSTDCLGDRAFPLVFTPAATGLVTYSVCFYPNGLLAQYSCIDVNVTIIDPCSDARSCSECAGRQSCGWCASTLSCLRMDSALLLTDTPAACPVAVNWQPKPSMCGQEVRTCPNGCSGHGTCDTTSRTCQCTGGYTGTDCSHSPALWQWIEDGTLPLDTPLILDERFAIGAPADTRPRLAVLDLNNGLSIIERVESADSADWSLSAQAPLSDLDLRTVIAAFDGVTVVLYSAIADDLTAYSVVGDTIVSAALPRNLVYTLGGYENSLVAVAASQAVGQLLLVDGTLVGSLATGELITMERSPDGTFALTSQMALGPYAIALSLTRFVGGNQRLLLRNGTALHLYTRTAWAAWTEVSAAANLPQTKCQTSWYHPVLSGSLAKGFVSGFPRVPCALYAPGLFVYFTSKTATLTAVEVSFYRQSAGGRQFVRGDAGAWTRVQSTQLSLLDTPLVLDTDDTGAVPFSVLTTDGGIRAAVRYASPPAAVGEYPLMEHQGYWVSTLKGRTYQRVATAGYMLRRQPSSPEYTLYKRVHACPEDCSGIAHGTCNTATGVCQCFGNYTGTTCATPVCPDACSGHGTCDPATAQCVCAEGWASANCGRRSCPSSSLGECNGGGGICNIETGACLCPLGFTGVDCASHHGVAWQLAQQVPVDEYFKAPFAFLGESVATLVPVTVGTVAKARLSIYTQVGSHLTVANRWLLEPPTDPAAVGFSNQFGADVRTLWSLLGTRLVTAFALTNSFTVWALDPATGTFTHERTVTMCDTTMQVAQVAVGVQGVVFVMTLQSSDPAIYSLNTNGWVEGCATKGASAAAAAAAAASGTTQVGRVSASTDGTIVTVYRRINNQPQITIYQLDASSTAPKYTTQSFALESPPLGLLSSTHIFVWSLRYFRTFHYSTAAGAWVEAAPTGLAYMSGSTVGVQALTFNPTTTRLVMTLSDKVLVYLWRASSQAWEESDSVTTQATFALYYASADEVTLLSAGEEVALYRPGPPQLGIATTTTSHHNHHNQPPVTFVLSLLPLWFLFYFPVTSFLLYTTQPTATTNHHNRHQPPQPPTPTTNHNQPPPQPPSLARTSRHARHIIPPMLPRRLNSVPTAFVAASKRPGGNPSPFPNDCGRILMIFVCGAVWNDSAPRTTLPRHPLPCLPACLCSCPPHPLTFTPAVAEYMGSVSPGQDIESATGQLITIPSSGYVQFNVPIGAADHVGDEEYSVRMMATPTEGAPKVAFTLTAFQPGTGASVSATSTPGSPCVVDLFAPFVMAGTWAVRLEPHGTTGSSIPVRFVKGANALGFASAAASNRLGGWGWSSAQETPAIRTVDALGAASGRQLLTDAYDWSSLTIGSDVSVQFKVSADQPVEVVVQRGPTKSDAITAFSEAATTATLLASAPCNATGRWWVGVRRSASTTVPRYTLTSSSLSTECPFGARAAANTTLALPTHTPLFQNSAQQGDKVPDSSRSAVPAWDLVRSGLMCTIPEILIEYRPVCRAVPPGLRLHMGAALAAPVSLCLSIQTTHRAAFGGYFGCRCCSLAPQVLWARITFVLAVVAVGVAYIVLLAMFMSFRCGRRFMMRLHTNLDLLYSDKHHVPDHTVSIGHQTCEGGVGMVLTVLVMVAVAGAIVMPRIYGTYYISVDVSPGFNGQATSAFPVALNMTAVFEGALSPCVTSTGACDPTYVNAVLYRLEPYHPDNVSMACNGGPALRYCSVSWFCTNCSYADSTAYIRLELPSGTGANGAVYATRIRYALQAASVNYPADTHTFEDVLEAPRGGVFLGGTGLAAEVDATAPSAVVAVVTPTVYQYTSEPIAIPDSYKAGSLVGVNHDLLSHSSGNSATLAELQSRLKAGAKENLGVALKVTFEMSTSQTVKTISPTIGWLDSISSVAGMLSMILTIGAVCLSQYEARVDTVLSLLGRYCCCCCNCLCDCRKQVKDTTMIRLQAILKGAESQALLQALVDRMIMMDAAAREEVDGAVEMKTVVTGVARPPKDEPMMMSPPPLFAPVPSTSTPMASPSPVPSAYMAAQSPVPSPSPRAASSRASTPTPTPTPTPTSLQPVPSVLQTSC